MNGFSLHAAVRRGADQRQALEQLRRDITQLALAVNACSATPPVKSS